MFDSVREWNRDHISNYREIYVKTTMQTLQERNQKGLYSDYLSGKEKELAGVQIAMEEPKHPDLVLVNDGDKTPEEQVNAIINYFKE
jgi:adenylylsulfate kinase